MRSARQARKLRGLRRLRRLRRLRELRDDRGSVTAEFAVVLPIVLVVLGLVIGGIVISAHRITLTSAAAEVVRLEARGHGDEAAARLARLGGDVTVEREGEGSLLCISLSDRPGAGLLSRIAVQARACAATSDVGELP